MKAVVIAAAATLLLAACSDADVSETKTDITPTDANIAFADEAVPADGRVADLYNRSCRACHSVEGMEAPLTGHVADWNARLAARGMDGLLASTKNGYEGMPAMGQCNDCSDDDFRTLISFMAKGE